MALDFDTRLEKAKLLAPHILKYLRHLRAIGTADAIGTAISNNSDATLQAAMLASIQNLGGPVVTTNFYNDEEWTDFVHNAARGL